MGCVVPTWGLWVILCWLKPFVRRSRSQKVITFCQLIGDCEQFVQNFEHFSLKIAQQCILLWSVFENNCKQCHNKTFFYLWSNFLYAVNKARSLKKLFYIQWTRTINVPVLKNWCRYYTWRCNVLSGIAFVCVTDNLHVRAADVGSWYSTKELQCSRHVSVFWEDNCIKWRFSNDELDCYIAGLVVTLNISETISFPQSLH